MDDILRFIFVDLIWGIIIVKLFFYGYVGKKFIEWSVKKVETTDKGKFHLDRFREIYREELAKVRQAA